MSKQSVLQAIQFYGPSNWIVRTGKKPEVLSSVGMDLVIQAVSYLYDNSPTAREHLEYLASAGSIRIGGMANNGAFSPPVTQPDGHGGIETTDPYIMIDPNWQLMGISNSGTLFKIPFELILAHELSHWRNGTGDVGELTNDAMNTPGFDYVGDTVRSEWTIALELGLSDVRATYQAVTYAADPRFSYFDLSRDYADDNVQIVRLGNVDKESTGNLDPNDVIDYTGRTENTLTFAFSGDDDLFGSDGNDWAYGGDGRDELHGGAGDDHLFGEGGNDLLDTGPVELGGGYADGGDGDDIIIAGGYASVRGGAGADQFWIRPGSIFIEDAGPEDTIFWNGYQLFGGPTTVIDFEYDNSTMETPSIFIGSLDSHDVVYDFSFGTLLIRTPNAFIYVDQFDNGDLGITFDNMFDSAQVEINWDEEGSGIISWYANVPVSEIVYNGTRSDLFNLPGWASPTPGLLLEPIHPLA